MDNNMDVEQLCTTLWVYKTTRARIRKAMGKGITVDRFLNDLLDEHSPKEQKRNEDEKADCSQD